MSKISAWLDKLEEHVRGVIGWPKKQLWTSCVELDATLYRKLSPFIK